MTERPTIVLLRGWMRDGRHWESFPDELSQQLDLISSNARPKQRPRIICADLPGNGSRYSERTPDSIGGMMSAIRSELKGTELVLVGISMGGMLAAEWVQRYPEDVVGFACINSSMRPHAYPWERLKLNNWLRILARLATSLVRKSGETAAVRELERFIMQLTLRPEFRTEDRLEQWVKWTEANPVTPGNALRQLRAAAAYKDPLVAPLAVPCLVLRSLGDALVDPVCSERLATAWQQTLQTHPSAGHDLAVEDPAWLAEALASWYNSHWPLKKTAD
ncbi:alpha/beta hydrolase [Allohahella marinimesophila]